MQRGKGDRCQQLVSNVLHEWAVLLSLGVDCNPLGGSEECAPTLLTVGYAVSGEHVVN